MTREEAINEINKVFTSAYANYIVTALTEGATVSYIQHRCGRAYEAGVKDGLEQEQFKPMVEIDLDYVIKQKYIEREVLDKIRAEIYNAIEFERKWLCDAGHTSKDIDIALNAIKSKVKDVLEKGAESEEGKNEIQRNI